MKKLFTLIAVALLAAVSVNAKAQDITWGVKAGANLSTVTKWSGTDMKLDLVLGVTADYSLGGNMGLSAEALYSGQGYAATLEDGTALWNFSYLNIPILFNYTIFDGFNAKAGLQPGFVVWANNAYDGQVNSIKNGYNVFDLSLPIGVSYELPNVPLVLDLRYNIGLTDMFETGDANNSVWALTVGYKF